METDKIYVKGYFKSLQIVHLALVLGIVFFALITIFLQLNGFGDLGEDLNNIFFYTVIAFTIGGLFASNMVFKKKLGAINPKNSLLEKGEKYREALIIKFALIEGPAFFSIVVYMLTGNSILLIIIAFLVVVFIINRPTKDKFVIDLGLNSEERKFLGDDENVF